MLVTWRAAPGQGSPLVAHLGQGRPCNSLLRAQKAARPCGRLTRRDARRDMVTAVASDPIYLDYNATTPLHDEVKQAMVKALELFGNPSSGHAYGARAKDAITASRASVAALTGAGPNGVVFTSGGTESNNWALIGGARSQRSAGRGSHIITSAIEHPAVTEVCKHLEQEGFEVDYVPVDAEGIVQLDEVRKVVRSDTVLVSVMHANNEVGSVQPIAEIAQIARSSNPHVLVHTDASQSVGKIPANIHDLGVDLLTIAGHKLYAPKGVGALIMKEGVALEKYMHGAGHERGLRAGTENTVHIVALGKACELALATMGERVQHSSQMRELLRASLVARLTEKGISFRVNGPADPAKRLPNTLSISLKGQMGSEVVARLAPQVAFSAGSACHHGQVTVSSVLAAMQIPTEFALGTLRLSVGKDTTEEDVTTAVDCIVKAVDMARMGA